LLSGLVQRAWIDAAFAWSAFLSDKLVCSMDLHWILL